MKLEEDLKLRDLRFVRDRLNYFVRLVLRSCHGQDCIHGLDYHGQDYYHGHDENA
jgi:hypothetical protein